MYYHDAYKKMGSFFGIGLLLALLMHFIILVLLNGFSNHAPQPMKELVKPHIINIDFIAEHENKPTQQKPTLSPIKEHMELGDGIKEPTQKKHTELGDGIKEPTQKIHHLSAKSKYATLIGKHIKSKFSDIPDDLVFDSKVNLLLSLDADGQLKGSKILTTHNTQLTLFITNILQLSSPFPRPPAEHLSNGEATYNFVIFPE